MNNIVVSGKISIWKRALGSLGVMTKRRYEHYKELQQIRD
jgi:hypothetical protein